MQVTSIGHAGLLIEAFDVSILCDPWFLPAFRGSWFVFPRNDQLSSELMTRIEHPDYLYISHLHADHFDECWLKDHVSRSATVLLPEFPDHELESRIRSLGFSNIIRTIDGQEITLHGSLKATIYVETTITDGPGGDSALVVSDGVSRVLNQNDCRITDLEKIYSHGPIDLHWLQYSGAIWYPMVYEETPEQMRLLVDAKVESQFKRAMHYVKAVAPRAVVPSAGPPAFLDPVDLFRLNMITGEELSIFTDQLAFLDRLATAGQTGLLVIPGSTIKISQDSLTVTHLLPNSEIESIYFEKEKYLYKYQSDWSDWLAAERAGWAAHTPNLLKVLKEWWEPLLGIAPTLRSAIGANCLLRLEDLQILIDFPAGQVRRYLDDPYEFRFDLPRSLVETVVAEHSVDWSNSLFLSFRFTAWRKGPFNEYLYNFFKSLSYERMQRTEGEAHFKLNSKQGVIANEVFQIGDYLCERTCPHRHADLSVFGELQVDQLVCTLHGWRFDLETGQCINARERKLRIHRACAANHIS